MIARWTLIYLLVLMSVVNILCDKENVTTRKRRFTRMSTFGTPATSVIVEDEPQTTIKETLNVIAPELVLPAQVNISKRKSFRVRNCGERIGDDVPFIALLVHTNPYDKESRKRTLSKGVLISENFVLTTVSSIYHSETFWMVSSVRLGDFVTWNKYANRDKSYSLEIKIDEIYLHKKRDIALIKLKESVNFTDVIRPACLPQSDNFSFRELRSHLCKRSHHPKIPADVTLEYAAPLSNFDCRKFFSRKHIAISQYEMCVWDETGDDCAGDLATALFTLHNGRMYLYGLRSYAETDDEGIANPWEYPGIYVQVSSYLDWISAVINADSNKTSSFSSKQEKL